MQKTIQTSLSNRRVVTLVAIAAVLAAVFLIQGSAFRGFAAAPARHRVAAAPSAIIFFPPCDTADISPVSSPQVPGAQVALTASSTGCLNPVYRFLLLAPGTATWVFKTGYQSSPTYTFDTTGAAQGVWQIGVWAKDSSSSARYQSWSINSFNVATPFCTGAHIDVYNPNAFIEITGLAVGCPAPTYAILKLAPGSSTWQLVKPYGPIANAYTWDTTNVARGPYRWLVEARQLGSPHRYDTYSTLTSG